MIKIKKVFDLLEFEKKIVDYKGQSENIYSYVKILNVKPFTNNQEIIEEVSYLEILDLQEYISKDNYKTINSDIDNVCQVKRCSYNSLPDQLKFVVNLR